MRLGFFGLSLLAPLVLTACATPGKELLAASTRALAEAPLCCTSLATARRAPLPAQPADVVIDHTAQAFNFGGNKAFLSCTNCPGSSKHTPSF